MREGEPPRRPSARLPVERHVSSGAVIFRRNGDQVEVALIGLRGGTRWGLPKGAVEEGEDHEATALREVREETGLEGRSLGKLGEIQYWFQERGRGVRIHKTVHFYLLECLGGSVEQHDQEVEDVRWYRIGEARDVISHANERDMLSRAEQLLEAAGRAAAATPSDETDAPRVPGLGESGDRP